jgi:hypothetical protein
MPIPLGSRMDISLVSHSSFLFACATRRACEDEYDRKTSFASQDRTDSRSAATDAHTRRCTIRRRNALTNVTPPAAISLVRKRTNDDAPGCRLPQAVAATHVRTRTISHARTPGTIPSSRCQTTRARSMLRACANKCSHGRDFSRLVEPVGIEPTTSCLQSTRSPS